MQVQRKSDGFLFLLGISADETSLVEKTGTEWHGKEKNKKKSLTSRLRSMSVNSGSCC